MGFVRNLPHGLIEAFKATLEEALLAEFLIHVIDASNPLADQFLKTTLEVLKELGADEKQIVTVFNKLDQVNDPGILAGFRLHYPNACFVSAHTGEGTDTLLAACVAQIADRTETLHLRFPHHRGDLVALAHGKGCVHDEKYEDEYVALHATLPRRMHETFAPFIQDSVHG